MSLPRATCNRMRDVGAGFKPAPAVGSWPRPLYPSTWSERTPGQSARFSNRRRIAAWDGPFSVAPARHPHEGRSGRWYNRRHVAHRSSRGWHEMSCISLAGREGCPGGGTVDAADLKSASRNGSVGSNPSLGTTLHRLVSPQALRWATSRGWLESPSLLRPCYHCCSGYIQRRTFGSLYKRQGGLPEDVSSG